MTVGHRTQTVDVVLYILPIHLSICLSVYLSTYVYYGL